MNEHKRNCIILRILIFAFSIAIALSKWINFEIRCISVVLIPVIVELYILFDMPYSSNLWYLEKNLATPLARKTRFCLFIPMEIIIIIEVYLCKYRWESNLVTASMWYCLFWVGSKRRDAFYVATFEEKKQMLRESFSSFKISKETIYASIFIIIAGYYFLRWLAKL